MNDETSNLDQTDENILTYTVSDEEIEAAAGVERGVGIFDTRTPTVPLCRQSERSCPPARRR